LAIFRENRGFFKFQYVDLGAVSSYGNDWTFLEGPRVGLPQILFENKFRAKIFSNLHILCPKNSKTVLFELVDGTSLPISNLIELIPFARRSLMFVDVPFEG